MHRRYRHHHVDGLPMGGRSAAGWKRLVYWTIAWTLMCLVGETLSVRNSIELEKPQDVGKYIMSLSVDSYMAGLHSEEEINDFKAGYAKVKELYQKLKALNLIDSPIRLSSNTKDDILIHELAAEASCNKTKICDGMDICTEVCLPGTVQVSSWLSNALTTQRRLQLPVPLTGWSLPGSHNSAITRARSYGLEEQYLAHLVQLVDSDQQVFIADQQFALADQFNMGARHIELDIHWYDGEIRICHAGGVHLKYLDEFIQEIVKLFHIHINWDSETLGCFSKHYRTLNQTFEEINDWISQPENSNEVFIFMFDDQEDLKEWKKVQLIMQNIEYYFADIVFGPPQKQSQFNTTWPTMDQLIQLKKRIIFTSRVDYGSQMYQYIFPRTKLWSEFGPSSLKKYPVCSLNSTFVTNQGNMSRVLGDSVIYGPFFNGPSHGGVITPTSLPALMQCNVNFPCLDQISPALVNYEIWTWDDGQPSISQGPVCVAINPKGRWETANCTTFFPFACRNTVDNSWKITTKTLAPWQQGSTVCNGLGQNYQFSVPTNGYENTAIHSLAKGRVWINYNSPT